VTSDAVLTVGRNVTGERRRALRALGSLAGERAVVTRVAAAGADRRMAWHAHGVGDKARCRVGVAVAALNSSHWNVRRRLHASRGGAVVAARAIGVGGRMFECPARPAGEGRSRAGVTGDAVGAIGCDMSRIRCGPDRALCTLAGERPVVAGVASAGADRRVARNAHRIGNKTRRRVGVAVAALNSRHRDVRRCS
jgi:hypothetical protein